MTPLSKIKQNMVNRIPREPVSYSLFHAQIDYFYRGECKPTWPSIREKRTL